MPWDPTETVTLDAEWQGAAWLFSYIDQEMSYDCNK